MITGALRDAIDELLAADPNDLDPTELHDAVVDVLRQANRLRAATCRLVRSWDVRHVWSTDGSRAPGARLSREVGLPKSAADHLVHQARKLDDMPVTAAAFGAGEICSNHVDLIATAKRPWPNATFAEAEALLVDVCKTPWFTNAARAVEYWKQRVDPDEAERDGHDRNENRYASIGTTWRGEVNLKAVFDPLGGAAFEEELHRLCDLLRHQDERDGVTRTSQQRRADALVEMANRSRTAPVDGLRPRPLLTITMGVEPFNRLCELADGTVIAPGLVIPYLSDADIERIVYDPPNRKIEASYRRRFTGALRRIIEVRDRHCQHHSGCDIRASRCDVDHIVPRSEGGATSLENGELKCPAQNRIPKLRNAPPKQPRLAADPPAGERQRPPPQTG